MRRWWLVVGLVVVVGCSASILIVRAGTRPERLSDTELAPILAASGDLPAGYIRRDPFTALQSVYTKVGVPWPDSTLSQIYDHPDEMEGLVTIFLYSKRPQLADAYQRLTHDLLIDAQPLDGLGEQAAQSTAPLNHTAQVSMVFVRCQALIYLSGYELPVLNAPLLRNWAQTIDQRIQKSSICQQ